MVIVGEVLLTSQFKSRLNKRWPNSATFFCMALSSPQARISLIVTFSDPFVLENYPEKYSLNSLVFLNCHIL